MYTVVLIDDEFYFRKAIKVYFADWENQYQIIGETKDGKEGLEMIRRLQPDIVLMDINMPLMNGLEVIQILFEESMKNGLNRKIIFLTGYGEFEYAQKALRFGVFDYLLKPIDKNKLKACLDKAAAQITKEKEQKDNLAELTRLQINEKKLHRDKFIAEVFDSDRTKNLNVIEQFSRVKGTLKLHDKWMPLMLYVYLEHVEEKQEEATFHYLIADNILTELLESREIQCMTSIYKDSLCMIATGNMEAEDLSNEMNETLNEFLAYVNEKFPMKVLIVKGPVIGDQDDMVRSIHQLEDMQKFLLMYQKQGVFSSNDSKTGYAKANDFFEQKNAQLYLNLRIANENAVQSLVKDIFTEMRENEVLPETVIKRAVDMVSGAFDIYQLQEKETESIDELQLLPPKFTEYDISLIESKVMAYLTLIIRHVKATKENKRNFLSVHVEEYIKKEYYRCDLTLQDIAYAFGVSKTAICNQFKEATGMTIGEYLFQTRMQYAHKMFDENYGNVSYVAEKCGYEDAGYFSKCFKKYYGISPREYISKI